MIHNELADYSFALREVAREELEAFVHSEELDAYCVTIPYKKEIMPLGNTDNAVQNYLNMVFNYKKNKKYVSHMV